MKADIYGEKNKTLVFLIYIVPKGNQVTDTGNQIIDKGESIN